MPFNKPFKPSVRGPSDVSPEDAAYRQVSRMLGSPQRFDPSKVFKAEYAAVCVMLLIGIATIFAGLFFTLRHM